MQRETSDRDRQQRGEQRRGSLIPVANQTREGLDLRAKTRNDRFFTGQRFRAAWCGAGLKGFCVGEEGVRELFHAAISWV